jgi:hypothetical protein
MIELTITLSGGGGAKSLNVLATPELLMTMARCPRPRGLRRRGVGLLAAIRICPLAAKKKTAWQSQGATGFASRHTTPLHRPILCRLVLTLPSWTAPSRTTSCARLPRRRPVLMAA